MFEKLKLWNLKNLHNIRAKNAYYAYLRWKNYPIRDYHELHLSNVVVPAAEDKLNAVREELGLVPVTILNWYWYTKDSININPLYLDWKKIFI